MTGGCVRLCRRGRGWLRAMLVLALLALLLVGPGQALADGPRSVQPGDRLHGQWAADMDSVRDYLTSVLEPVGGHCMSVSGSITYSFRLTGDARLHAMTCSVVGNQVQIKRVRAGGARSDSIAFLYSGSYSSPVTVRPGERILETSDLPDFSFFNVEGFSINGVFMGEMDFNMTGLSQAYGASRLRYEFAGDNTLRLTPIFPPAPDGVPIHARPYILHRLSHDPDRR